MSHPEISSVAEPWLLLPFCYALRGEGALTEYGHVTGSRALSDFVNNLQGKETHYFSELRNFAHNLYQGQCTFDEKFFLDKTPRYYLIIPEILQIFPDAKFIFLFRNPVHILSSVIETWGNGRLNRLYPYTRDLTIGPNLLDAGSELLAERAISIRYEDFVENPERFTVKICDFIGIKYSKDMLVNFSNQNTKGRMGDPTGITEYSKISTASLSKWEKTFSSVVRKIFVRRYLLSLDQSVLERQGYSKEKILCEIDRIKVTKFGVIDLIDLMYSRIVELLKPNIWFGKTTPKWAAKWFIS